LWADAQGFVFLSLMKAGLSTLIKTKPCRFRCRVFSFVGVAGFTEA